MTEEAKVSLPAATARGRQKRAVKASGVVVLAAAALVSWKVLGRSEPLQYTKAPVEKADVVKSISATGKLQAVVTVQVGSQVSGRIADLYADFNSRVKKGEVIARLDPSLFQAQLDQALG